MPVVQNAPQVDEGVRRDPAAFAAGIKIYSHSTILYWWPVWAVGFVMAALTYLDGSRAVIVPAGATYDAERHAIILPVGSAHAAIGAAEIGERAASSKNLGVVFTATLLSVVFVTNTPLRGLWSAIAVLLVAVATVTFAWLGWWADIFTSLGRITIHMNLGFYVTFSTLLFVLWASVVFGFDRMRYWRFLPGQLTFESALGGGQKSFDTSGILFEKLRDDPFRHWLLGLGSGDLVITTHDAANGKIQIPNVCALDRVLPRLQRLVAERPA